MTVPFRTILQWLDEQGLGIEAEVWVLGKQDVEPVLHIEPMPEDGSVAVRTASVWSVPVPVPLRYGTFRARVQECYSGAGTLRWKDHPDTYRGSYTVNPQSAVFLLFLPDETQLILTHEEKMEQKRKRARELTEVIQESWQP